MNKTNIKNDGLFLQIENQLMLFIDIASASETLRVGEHTK